MVSKLKTDHHLPTMNLEIFRLKMAQILASIQLFRKIYAPADPYPSFGLFHVPSKMQQCYKNKYNVVHK